MKIALIPFALFLFVLIYPTAEYNIDCPTGVDDPKGNEDCTWTKMILWNTVSALSLTELGFPPDRVFFVEANNPDAYHNHSLIPTAVATLAVVGVEFVYKRRITHKFSKETTESLR